MDLQDFVFGINRLQRFYKKKLDQDQEDEYFQRIRNIPQEIFIRAIDDIIDSSRFFPAPGEFKTYWYQWQVTNPGRIYQDKEYCAECKGEGILYFTAHPKGATFSQDYEYMVRCASCKNWKGDVGTFVPRMTIQQLENKGFKVIQKITWDKTQDKDRDINSQVPF